MHKALFFGASAVVLATTVATSATAMYAADPAAAASASSSSFSVFDPSQRYEEDPALYEDRVAKQKKVIAALEAVMRDPSLLEAFKKEKERQRREKEEAEKKGERKSKKDRRAGRRDRQRGGDIGAPPPRTDAKFWEAATAFTPIVDGEAVAEVGRDFWDICNQVTSLGFACEHHTVVTEDGFELDVIRIPPKGNPPSPVSGTASLPLPAAPSFGYPVILQHGLIDTASCWVANYHPQQNLGTILAASGYDVFMPNARGNSYSQKNRAHGAKSDEYWQRIDKDFMAKYDMPANIDYALNLTKQSTLSYVGHSQGGMMGFAAFSTWQPSLASKVDYFFALAPACWVHDTRADVIRLLAALSVAEWLHLFGLRSFLDNQLIEFIMAQICPIVGFACTLLLDILCGPSKQINTTQLATITRYTPGGTSVSNMIHWSQEVRSDVWGTHNFGTKLNEKYWGSKSNPSYTPNAMRGPKTVVFYGEKDALAHPRDVKKLLDRVPADVIVESRQLPNYAHLDFTWGVNAHLDIYPTILSYLSKVRPAPAPNRTKF